MNAFADDACGGVFDGLLDHSGVGESGERKESGGKQGACHGLGIAIYAMRVKTDACSVFTL